MNLREIPGYSEALDKEEATRARVCIEASTKVCGVPLRTLKLRDFVNLQAMKSPFVTRGYIRKIDCLQFFCLMSVDYKRPKAGWFERFKAKRRNFRVLKKLRGIKTVDMICGINDFLEEMFMDSPSSSSRSTDTAPIASSTASIIDILASWYGWRISDVMDLEMPLIFQLFRLRTIAQGGSPSAIINKKSSKIIGDYLRKLNSTEEKE